MNFQKISKANTTNDTLPTASAPTTRIIHLPGTYDKDGSEQTASVAVYIRVLDSVGAVISAGTATLQLFLYDTANTIWVPASDPITACPVNSLRAIGFPPLPGPTDAWIAVTSVTGTDRTSVDVYVQASGLLAGDVNIGDVTLGAVTVTSGSITADTELPAAAAVAEADTSTVTTVTVAAISRALNAARTGLSTLQAGTFGKVLAATGVKGFLNVLAASTYNATRLALADGDFATAQCDQRGYGRNGLMAERFVTLTPDAANDIANAPCDGLMTSLDTTLVFDDNAGGTSISIFVAAGSILPIRAKRIRTTSAGAITAVWCA